MRSIAALALAALMMAVAWPAGGAGAAPPAASQPPASGQGAPADGSAKPGQGQPPRGPGAQGKAGQGKAGQGKAGQGKAGQGKAGQGKAGKPAQATPGTAKPRQHQANAGRTRSRKGAPAKTRGGPPRKPRVVFDEKWATAPSARYAALDRDRCHAELRARGVTFTVVKEARGVAAPVRLPKDVAGVVWRTELPAADRAHAPWDVIDCRVVLAMHDWSPRLRGRGITEVLLYSAWRPPPASWPVDQPATRHPGALAIDVKRMIREPDPATGAPRRDLDVDRDWDPKLGAPICGPSAPPPSPATPEAAELRAITCEVDDAQLFTVLLTPHYDHAHRNHLHLEITPEVTWRLTK